jgi:hypothetical protein
MVSRELFTKTVQKLRNTYNRQDFLTELDALNDWYEHFKDCSEWSFKKAVNKTINECYKLPVVAELYTRYKECESYRLQQRNYFATGWGDFCYDHPNGYKYKDDCECQRRIMELTTNKCDGDYEEGLKLLEKYRAEMKQYLQKTDNPPDFKDYLMGLE